jgi:hypothetical protein
MKQLLVIALVSMVLPCAAQPAPKAVTPGEPEVQRTVIEDTGVRIEELRVRGQVQRITVSPKVGGRAKYEIITGGGATDIPGGINSGRGAAGTAGKSAWNLFAF